MGPKAELGLLEKRKIFWPCRVVPYKLVDFWKNLCPSLNWLFRRWKILPNHRKICNAAAIKETVTGVSTSNLFDDPTPSSYFIQLYSEPLGGTQDSVQNSTVVTSFLSVCRGKAVGRIDISLLKRQIMVQISALQRSEEGNIADAHFQQVLRTVNAWRITSTPPHAP